VPYWLLDVISDDTDGLKSHSGQLIVHLGDLHLA
jgi:hypothetical protein